MGRMDEWMDGGGLLKWGVAKERDEIYKSRWLKDIHIMYLKKPVISLRTCLKSTTHSYTHTLIKHTHTHMFSTPYLGYELWEI